MYIYVVHNLNVIRKLITVNYRKSKFQELYILNIIMSKMNSRKEMSSSKFFFLLLLLFLYSLHINKMSFFLKYTFHTFFYRIFIFIWRFPNSVSLFPFCISLSSFSFHIFYCGFAIFALCAFYCFSLLFYSLFNIEY